MDIRLYILLIFAVHCQGHASTELADLMKNFWDWRMEEFPEFATSIGVDKYNDRLTSYNVTVYPERKATIETYKTRLDGIDRNELSKVEKVNYDILRDTLETYINGYRWLDWGVLNPVNFLEGQQTDPSSVTRAWPLKTKKDFENYLDRLQLMERRLDEYTALFRKAIEIEMTLHNVSVNRVPGQIENFLVEDPKQFVMYSPFNETLTNITDISDQVKDALRTRAERVIEENVLEPYRKFKTFLENEYMPETRTSYGVSSWPLGEEFYEACLKWHLSEEITAEDVHKRGLNEVDRISGQMIKLIRSHDSELSIPEYFAMLKANPEYKYDTSEDILEGYRDIVFDRIDPKLKDFFESIPDTPLEVRRMAFDGTVALYSPGSADGSRPGIFWVNVMRPNATNTFDMMALSLHEASPGHHLQISHMLLVDLPDFRKYTLYTMNSVPFEFPVYTTYIEGWGLYAEYLGEEMGLYKEDHELLGRYSFEIFRACRLVIDTGIHALSWTREDAIQYMLNYTALDRPDVEVEIDRYITWPGQACAYKIGELEILDLRKNAEKKLGDKFDLKEFHATVLDVGAVPFSIVEQAVQDMIDSHQTRDNSGSIAIQSSAWIVFTPLFMSLFRSA